MAVYIQRTYVLFLKTLVFVFDDGTEKIHINKSHTYYNRIQMQLALTTQTWCDFVFYT